MSANHTLTIVIAVMLGAATDITRAAQSPGGGSSPARSPGPGDAASQELVGWVQDLLERGELHQAAQIVQALEDTSPAVEVLRGWIALRQGDAQGALDAFEAVVKKAPHQTHLWPAIAQAHLELGRPQAAAEALERLTAPQRTPFSESLTARVHLALGQDQRAHEVLQRAVTKYPKNHDLLVELAAFLGSHRLREALSALVVAAPLDTMSRHHLKALASLSASARCRPQVLETLRQRAVDDADITAATAYAHRTAGELLTAARLYGRATQLGGPYALAAAEHLRDAGRPREALAMTSWIADSRERLTARLGLWVHLGEYERASSMADALEREGLLRCDAPDACPGAPRRWLLAYSAAAQGDPASARRWLEGVPPTEAVKALLGSPALAEP